MSPTLGHAPHGGRIELAVLPAVPDHGVVDRGVAGVGDDRLAVLELSLGVPHPPGIPDHGGHGRVDDDVAGDVEVGDPPVRIDHGDARSLRQRRLDVTLDSLPLRLGEVVDPGQHVAQPVVRVYAQLLENVSVALEDVREEEPGPRARR